VPELFFACRYPVLQVDYLKSVILILSDFIIPEMKMTKNIAVINIVTDMGNSGIRLG
jgi:hypothetical protein